MVKKLWSIDKGRSASEPFVDFDQHNLRSWWCFFSWDARKAKTCFSLLSLQSQVILSWCFGFPSAINSQFPFQKVTRFFHMLNFLCNFWCVKPVFQHVKSWAGENHHPNFAETNGESLELFFWKLRKFRTSNGEGKLTNPSPTNQALRKPKKES